MDTLKEADFSGTNCSLTVECLFNATATGDGYWGMEAGTVVTFTRLNLFVTVYNDDDGKVGFGEVQAYHDKGASEHGLCYTDKGITAGVKEFILAHPVLSSIIQDAGGSEQGMQGEDMFSMDVTLNKKFTIDELVAAGMGNVEHWD